MNGDVIAFLIDRINRCDVLYVSGKHPRCFDRNKRVIAVYFHAKRCSCVCNLCADGAQSDNTKLFAADLMTGKFLFRLLHIFGDIFIVLLLLAPVDAADYVSGSQQHASQHQLFDTVCIGARCIEYDNTSLRTLVKRNVVDARSGTCNGTQSLRKFQIMHGSTADQNALCLRQVVSHLIIFGQ